MAIRHAPDQYPVICTLYRDEWAELQAVNELAGLTQPRLGDDHA